MAGLLEKDILFLMKKRMFFLIVILIGWMLGVMSGNDFVISYLTMMGGILAYSTIAYDEQERGFTFLLTLPVDAKGYVFEKYIFSVFTAVIFWFVGLIFFAIGCIFTGNPFGNLSAYMVYIPIVILLLDLAIPCQIKFGSEKSRIVLLLVMGIAVGGFLLFDKITTSSDEKLMAIIEAMNEIPEGTWFAIMMCVSLIITFISCAISIHIINKKEF